MYNIDNWKGEMETYLGADDPKYNNQETFTVYEVASLYYNFMPDPSDEIFLEERKEEYNNKINELKKRLMGAIATKLFTTSGVGEVNGITILNRHAISAFFNSIAEQCPKVFMPKTVYTPSYLDPQHADYCPELALGIDVCEQIYIQKVGSSSLNPPIKIENYLHKNYKSLRTQSGRLEAELVDRLKIVCNSKSARFKKNR